MKGLTDNIIITCEHGSNQVPSEYRHLFAGQQSVLNSHRGWDAGALELAKALARTLKASLVCSEITRLLIDLNRSPHHPRLYSVFSRNCDRPNRERLFHELYLLYRKQVESEIKAAIKIKPPVIHFSIHSFTPVLDGTIRNADIGLLYDPKRKRERIICKKLKSILKNNHGNPVVRLNYPYRGNADGMTTALRKKYSDKHYAGIEIEINQKHVKNKKHWKEFQKETITSIMQFIHGGYVYSD